MKHLNQHIDKIFSRINQFLTNKMKIESFLEKKLCIKEIICIFHYSKINLIKTIINNNFMIFIMLITPQIF